MPAASGESPAASQLVGVGANHVCQHVRVAGVALGPRHLVPLAEPGRLQRVHREHPVARRGQRAHPRAVICLDPDQHLAAVSLFAQQPARQRVQLRHPGHPSRQPPSRQHLPGLVHHLRVVMVLSPVITYEQPHSLSRSQRRNHPAASGRTISDLIKQ